MILLADSGSTKTAWRLIKSDGKILQFASKGIHPFFMTEDEIESLLQKELCGAIGFPDNELINEIYFYGAGCANPERSKPVQHALRKLFPKADLHVESDLLGAARGTCGRKPGIAIILGTGSNSCYYDGRSIAATRPSLGFILGDEGSGAWIGKNLLSSYLYGELPANLTASLEQRLGISKEIVLEQVYRKEFPNRYLAGFSKFVFQNIQDPSMTQLVKNGFQAFFDKHILHYENRHLPLHATGSVAFFYGKIFTHVAESHGYIIGSITESPAAGLSLYHLGEI